ncbi:MAG: M20/M25/M40 family metallo-hydrolase [Planctomycetales bacterium]|nr:M20/M25/M40 family metallo-hydrolase [Planctomycetales bacterium]
MAIAYTILGVILSAIVIAIMAAWRVMVWMPGRKPRRNAMPPLSDRERQVREWLETDLRALADEIGERHLQGRYSQLIDATALFERTLTEAGYAFQRQEFDVDGRRVWNVETSLSGSADAAPSLVIGAHYDTVPGSPGANDNGSAVVAGLALARLLANSRPRHTIRFVFFVNEESPYYMTEAMGSLRSAESMRDRGESLMGMIALETIGCYLDAAGSQRYPVRWLGYLYPTTGNFVAFVGLPGARRLVGRCITAFRRTRAFPSIGGVAPGFIPGIDLSDHWAYHHCGYPALMITDTAPFRNPHYHTRTDLPDTVNYPALAKITSGLTQMIRDLAS